jgi:hypothetical protein
MVSPGCQVIGSMRRIAFADIIGRERGHVVRQHDVLHLLAAGRSKIEARWPPMARGRVLVKVAYGELMSSQ